MTHEDYVSFEQAKKLKELGFDWRCETFWDDEGSQEHEWVIKQFHDYPFVANNEDCTIFRPTLAQAAKWLREKGIIIEVYCFNSSFPKQLVWNFTIVDNEDRELITPDHANPFSTYEQALSAGIDKALELLKQQSNG